MDPVSDTCGFSILYEGSLMFWLNQNQTFTAQGRVTYEVQLVLRNQRAQGLGLLFG